MVVLMLDSQVLDYKQAPPRTILYFTGLFINFLSSFIRTEISSVFWTYVLGTYQASRKSSLKINKKETPIILGSSILTSSPSTVQWCYSLHEEARSRAPGAAEKSHLSAASRCVWSPPLRVCHKCRSSGPTRTAF